MYCRLGYLSAKLGITSCSMWLSKTTRVSPAGATSVTCSPHFLLSFSPGLWYKHSLPPLRLSSHPEGKTPHVHLTDTVIHCACLVNVLPLQQMYAANYVSVGRRDIEDLQPVALLMPIVAGSAQAMYFAGLGAVE